PAVKGRRSKLFYATQARVAPPTFVFFARDAASVHFSYRRYLENKLRDAFGFLGTPLRLGVGKSERHGIRGQGTHDGAPERPGTHHATGMTPDPAPADEAARVAIVGAGAWGTTLAL